MQYSGGGEANADESNPCARREHGRAGTRYDIVWIVRWDLKLESHSDREPDDIGRSSGVPNAAVLPGRPGQGLWPALQSVKAARCGRSSHEGGTRWRGHRPGLDLLER